MSSSVVVAIKAVDEASSVFGKIQASLGVLGSSLGQLGGGFQSVGNVISGFAGAGVMGAASAALGEGIESLKWAIGEAASAEQAMKNLSIAVEKSGTAWENVRKPTEEFLSGLQKVTAYSDEQLAGTFERLLTFGMDYDEAMKAVKTTVDLAAAKHMDLQSAADLVGKAFMGNTTALQRYGIDVQTSKEASAALKEAVDKVAEGLEAAGTDTDKFAGALEKASIPLSDTEGKMRPLKEVASDLVGAFQSGKIPAEDFDKAMKALGVNVDASKLAAEGFPEVMSKLNEQFGGTAVEQAKTYAGTQERLKNATSDLGEKIGQILTPALTTLSEGMIPVVDQLGKGVDAIGKWFTEVGKMPEVKAVTDEIGRTFEGLQKWFGDVARTAGEILGPAFNDLWKALKDLWDALSPIGEAFSTLFKAFSEGQGSGNILKDLLGFMALSIKGIAEAIRLVAPVIKAFAEGFKEAAEIAGPWITKIVDAVSGALTTIRTAFEGFYNWLVGKSLWQDLWNQILNIAGTVITTLLGDLGTKLFEPIKGVFQDIGKAIEGIWNTAWDSVKKTASDAMDGVTGFLRATGMKDLADTMDSGFDAVQAAWAGDWDTAKAKVSDTFTNIEATTGLKMDSLKSAIYAGMDLIKGDWKGAWGNIEDALSTTWTDIETNTKLAVESVKTVINTALGEIKTAFETGWKAVMETVETAWSTITGTTSASTETMQGIVQGGGDDVVQTFRDVNDRLARHSIWPEMWASIVNVTEDGMRRIHEAVNWVPMEMRTQTSLGRVSDIIGQTINNWMQGISNFFNWLTGRSVWPEMFESMEEQTVQGLQDISGAMQRGLGEAVAPTVYSFGEEAAAPMEQRLTFPITVSLDGEVIYRRTEEYLVNHINLRGKKGA